MNKKWAASIIAALLPLSLTAFAADTAVANGEPLGQTNADNTMTVPVMKNKTVVPIDLDSAAKAYDVVLPSQPVHMSADSLLVRGSDGYIKSRGNVDMQQGMSEIHTGSMEGNTKTQVYHTVGPAVYITSDNALVGTDITYNGKNQGAVMKTIEGFMDPTTYIRGNGAEMYDGTAYVKHGLITTPHAVAKTPDYYLTGDDIHIYPGEKWTAENTALWFKHVRLFTYGHYEGRLDEVNKTKSWIYTLLPRPTYSSSDGVGVHGNATIPLNAKGDMDVNINYEIHSKTGFKPTAKLEKNTSIGQFKFGYSKEESSDNNDHIWATKWPELEYYAPRINFGNSGIYIDSSANWGRWSEDNRKTGGHKEYRAEITHVPISLWSRANLRFFAGYRRDLYSAYDAQRRDPYSGVVLNQGVNDRMWTSFWYKKHNLSGYTPYRFDSIDHPRQKGVSLGYVLTPRDTVIFSFAKNLDNGNVEDRNWTWIRDLHSFTAIVTYKQVDKEWEVKVVAKDFN
jgi:LPS-assembly protein